MDLNRPQKTAEIIRAISFQTIIPDTAPTPQQVPSLVGRRIGEIVVALGFATESEVDSAVEEARRTGRATGRVLYDRGTINKNQLAQAIAQLQALEHLRRNLKH